MWSLDWDFIVCANQLRRTLTNKAQEMPGIIWAKTGPDAGRGWAESEVGNFLHSPRGYSKSVNTVARRWREKGELPGCWHYSFLGTSIEPRM